MATMIKLIASILMFIDHMGVIFFPSSYFLRAIGRFSMPLFAYCLARGYYYSSSHGTLKKYFRNMAVIAVVSQIPFSLMQGGNIALGLNTCFTWLFSLLLLFLMNDRRFACCRHLIVVFSIFLIGGLQFIPWLCADYGMYGILVPVVLYYGLFEHKYDTYRAGVLIVALWGYHTLVEAQGSSLLQIISVGALPMVLWLSSIDDEIRFPKWFSYLFYPIHITLLLLVKGIVTTF